jgi:anti-sigma factor RsiW
MDCREFRNNHVAYVDDLLPAVDMDAMTAHLARCTSCARQDTAVRRSLLLVRNLRPIEPSADFMRRLNLRLAEIGPPPRYASVSRGTLFFSMPALGSFVALAAGIGAVAVLAVQTARYFSPEPVAASAAPIVATVDPFPDVAPLANAAYVAAVPTGIPLWPAVLTVGEAPVRFATMELQDGR